MTDAEVDAITDASAAYGTALLAIAAELKAHD